MALREGGDTAKMRRVRRCICRTLTIAAAGLAIMIPAGCAGGSGGYRWRPGKPLPSLYRAPCKSRGKLKWQGGSVQHDPVLYLVFWGSQWNKEGHTRRQIIEVLSSLGHSPWGQTLTQYCDSNGPIHNDVRVAAWWTDPRRFDASQKDVDELWRAIGINKWPDGNPNDQFILIMPEGWKPPGKYCGYHDAYTETAYAVVNGPGVDGCSGGLPDGAAQVTVPATHEVAETATDPDGESGWQSNVRTGEGEDADFCNWIGVGNGRAWVTSTWSDRKNGCVVAGVYTPGLS